MINKGRRPWKRGAKKRYSVYKHEDRIDGEKDYKEWAERIAWAKGYDLEKFLAHDVNPKSFWRVTYARIEEEWKRDPRNEEFGYKLPELVERARVLGLIQNCLGVGHQEVITTDPAKYVMEKA